MGSTGNLRFEFRMLGPFEVVSGGRVLEIGSAKQRALLALLLIHLNRPVSLDAIGEELWEGRPPASLGATVQSLVYRIRKLLGPDAEAAGVRLRGRGSGYVLEGEELQFDAHRFERLASRGRELAATGAFDSAARSFRDAVGLWRGPALDGLAELPFARLEAARLEGTRLLAVEGLAESELARGRPDEALTLLEPHVAANPLREAAWGQLMLTLYRLGRQAEALRAYQELRRVLAEDLGLEPNPALRELEGRILAQSPELGRPAPPESTTTAQPHLGPSSPPDTGQPAHWPWSQPSGPPPGPAPPKWQTPPPEAFEGALTTLMFTDVEGSTDLRTRLGDDAAQKLLHQHEQIVRAMLAEHGGREVKALGDGFLATFGSARRALTCAAAIQQAFEAQRWASPDEALRVRIGVNAGEVVEEGGDVFGQAVHVAARVAAKAKGGQVLVSELVHRLVGSVPDLNLRDAGRFRLKGFAERWRLFELVWADTRPAGSPVGAARTPLVGREAEVAELRTALREAMSGSVRLVMLAGEPGIGKTRLTEELAAEAMRSRALVFVGRCLEADGAPPYAPFVEILESALAQAPSPEAFRDAAGDGAPEIARLVPRLRRLFPDIAPALALPPEQERRYLFNSSAEMIARSARAVPTVVVLEDLHWADEATLLLLDHLARHLTDVPLLIVGTYRDVELDFRPALARTLDGLVRQRLVRQLHLARLPEGALTEMLAALSGQQPPEAVVDLVFKETEGNPFFVEEVFRHLAEEGRLLDADGRFRADVAIGQLEVPENVRLVVGRRLDRLSEDGRRVLGLAAVIGRSFRYELLEAAADLGDDAVLDAIDEAERARLVVATPGRAGGEEFGFGHELVRQTLLTRLSAPRRRKLHVAVAEAMERTLGGAVEDHAADLAHHLLEAGAAADPAATVRWLVLAGRRAMGMSAFEDALRAFEQALALGAAGGAEHAALLVDLARAQRSVGRWDDAAETSRTAIDAYEALGDKDAVGRICADTSWALCWLARFADGHEVAQRGLSAVAGRETPEEGYLLATLGMTTGLTGSYQAGWDVIDKATALAERLGDERLAAHVVMHRMHIEWCHVHHREAVDGGRAAAESHLAAGEVWDQAMTLGFVVFALAQLGRFSEVDELRAELEPLSQRLGCYPALALCHRARLLTDLCRTPDLGVLEADVARDFEVNEAIGGAWHGQSHTWQGLARFWRGDWVAAGPDFENGMRLDPDGPFNGWGWGWAFQHKAYMGDRIGALSQLAGRREDLPRPGAPAWWGRWMMLVAVIEGLAVLGEQEEAAGYHRVVADAIEAGAVSVNYHDLRLLERVAGIAAAAGRHWDTAQAHFEAALRLADELPHRIEALETRRFYGQMLVERDSPGDRDRAVALVEEAAAGYRSLGMPRHVGLAEALLGREAP